MKKLHKHAELIKAWADGAEIEYKSKFFNIWLLFNGNKDAWVDDYEYRIKPEKKPDFEIFFFYKNGELLSASYENKDPNLKLIFTGYGKLKDAEVLE